MIVNNFFFDKLNTENPLSLGQNKVAPGSFLFSDIIKVCEDDCELAGEGLSINLSNTMLGQEILSSSENVINTNKEELLNLSEYIKSFISQDPKSLLSEAAHNLQEVVVTKKHIVLSPNSLNTFLKGLIDSVSGAQIDSVVLNPEQVELIRNNISKNLLNSTEGMQKILEGLIQNLDASDLKSEGIEITNVNADEIGSLDSEKTTLEIAESLANYLNENGLLNLAFKNNTDKVTLNFALQTTPKPAAVIQLIEHASANIQSKNNIDSSFSSSNLASGIEEAKTEPAINNSESYGNIKSEIVEVFTKELPMPVNSYKKESLNNIASGSIFEQIENPLGAKQSKIDLGNLGSVSNSDDVNLIMRNSEKIINGADESTNKLAAGSVKSEKLVGEIPNAPVEKTIEVNKEAVKTTNADLDEHKLILEEAQSSKNLKVTSPIIKATLQSNSGIEKSKAVVSSVNETNPPGEIKISESVKAEAVSFSRIADELKIEKIISENRNQVSVKNELTQKNEITVQDISNAQPKTLDDTKKLSIETDFIKLKSITLKEFSKQELKQAVPVVNMDEKSSTSSTVESIDTKELKPQMQKNAIVHLDETVNDVKAADIEINLFKQMIQTEEKHVAEKNEKIISADAVYINAGKKEESTLQSKEDLKEDLTVKSKLSESEKAAASAKDGASSSADKEKSKSNEFAKSSVPTSINSLNDVENEKQKIFGELKNLHENIKVIKPNELMNEFSKYLNQGERQSITFQLTPENLGKVKLIIDMVENQLFTRIEVENEQVKHFIQSNIESLKQQLSSSGIQISNLSINLAEYDQRNQKPFVPKRKNSTKVSKDAVEEEIPVVQKRRSLGYNTLEFLA